jgi:hypothetical protein
MDEHILNILWPGDLLKFIDVLARLLIRGSVIRGCRWCDVGV